MTCSCAKRKDILVNIQTTATTPLENQFTEWISSEGVFLIHVPTINNMSVTVEQGVSDESGSIVSVKQMEKHPTMGVDYKIPTAEYFRLKVQSNSNWLPSWGPLRILARDVTPLLGVEPRK